jgi:hypothetical protein
MVNNENAPDYIIRYEEGKLDEEETIDLFLYLIDSGLAWKLQGMYGRTAVALNEGLRRWLEGD